MASVPAAIAESVGAVIGKWTVLTGVFSGVLYGLGYLALRFQLTALGVGTDLAVLDERYLFEGAKFLLVVVTAIPVGVLVGLPIAALGWLVGRGLSPPRMALAWWTSVPARPLITGIIFAVLLIQVVMRQCFAFNDLLLAAELPARPSWFRAILLAADDTPMNLFFAVLIVGVGVTAAALIGLGGWETARRSDRMLAGLLVVLLGVELLLLPVNYGYVSTRRGMPRVAAGAPAQTGKQTWLVWEGKEGMTYLVRDAKGERRLVTVPRSEVKRVEILAYDLVLRTLHGGGAR